MTHDHYARCLMCGRKYDSPEALKLEGAACLKCNYTGKTLDPRKDIVIKTSFQQFLWLAGLARDKAWLLAKSSDAFEWAPRVCKAIRERVAGQRKARKVNGIAVNWHELEVLGYWADQLLTDGMSLFPETYQGQAKRLMEFVMLLEVDHMAWPPLTASTKRARNEMERWAAKHGFTDKPKEDPREPEKVMEEDAMESFPVAPPSIIQEKQEALIHDFQKAGSASEQVKILNAAGQVEKTVTGEAH